MLPKYQHGSRENEHESAFQCLKGKVQRKDCKWVQSTTKKSEELSIFSINLSYYQAF